MFKKKDLVVLFRFFNNEKCFITMIQSKNKKDTHIDTNTKSHTQMHIQIKKRNAHSHTHTEIQTQKQKHTQIKNTYMQTNKHANSHKTTIYKSNKSLTFCSQCPTAYSKVWYQTKGPMPMGCVRAHTAPMVLSRCIKSISASTDCAVNITSASVVRM